jgi:RNA polymerase sigma-70 factor (ECF subfamily)
MLDVRAGPCLAVSGIRIAAVACAHAASSLLSCAVERTWTDAAQSDEELLEGWRTGAVRHGELLWRRHAQTVQRFFRNKVPWAVAMDLSQRTIECGLRVEHPVRSFRAYLLGIAKHQLFEYLRSEQRKQQREADLDTLVIDDTVASPEDWVSAKREKRLLLRALRRLPLPNQLVIELRYWERMSDDEIAEVLELPLGTVKTRIASGREALRKTIARLSSSPEQLQSTLDSLEQWASRTEASAAAPQWSGTMRRRRRG